MLFAVLMWAGTVTLHVYFMVHERTLGNFLVNVANLACAVVLYQWFVPGGGMVGAATADVIAQTLALALAAWLAQRWFQLDLRAMLRPLGWQFAAALLLMLPVWVLPWLHGGWLLSWAVTALAVMSLLLLRSGLPNRDELLRLQSFNWGKLNPIIIYGTGLVLRLTWLEKSERSIPPCGSPLDRR